MVRRRTPTSTSWLVVLLVVSLGLAACADDDATSQGGDLEPTPAESGEDPADGDTTQDLAGSDTTDDVEPGFAHRWQVTRADGWIFEVGLTLPPSPPVATSSIEASPPGSAQLQFEAPEGMVVSVEDATPDRTPPDSHREVYVVYKWSQDALAVGDLGNAPTLGRQMDGLRCRSRFNDGIICSLAAAAQHGRPTSSLTHALREWDESEVEDLVAAIAETPPEIVVRIDWVESITDVVECGFHVTADGSPSQPPGGGSACGLVELDPTGAQ